MTSRAATTTTTSTSTTNITSAPGDQSTSTDEGEGTDGHSVLGTVLALLSLAIAAGALAYKVRNAEDKKKALLQFFGCADEEAPPQVDDEVVGRLTHQLEVMVKTATLNSPGGGGGGVQADYFRAEVRSDQDIVAYAMDAVVHPPLDPEKLTVLLYAPGTYLLRQRAGGTSIAVSCKPKDGSAIVKTELQGTPHGTPEEKQAFFAEARSFANAAGAESIVLPAGAGGAGATGAATDDAEALYDSLYAVASATSASRGAPANQRNSPPPSAPQSQESAFAMAPGRGEQLGGESYAQSPAAGTASADIELAAREARAAAKKTAARKKERDRRRRNKRHSTESSVPAVPPFDSNAGGSVARLPTAITNPSFQAPGGAVGDHPNATVVGGESISFVKNNARGDMDFRPTSDV